MTLRIRLFQVRIRDAARDRAFCEKERVPSKGQKISHSNLPLPSFEVSEMWRITGARKCRAGSLETGKRPDSDSGELGYREWAWR